MVFLNNDYNTGAHPKVLQALLDTNLIPQNGYGEDDFCASAREKIKAACQCPEADVRFMMGGTQTNAIVISMMLRDFEGVISTDTGHIAAHESGAIEYSGHKVLTLPHKDGKLRAEDVRNYLEGFYADESHEQMMVFPGMVYISHPTEYGTLYSKQELTELSQLCREHQIPLYLDGARLAYALMSRHTDVTLPDIARLCDAFYIGGTKAGTLCGEAVVFTKNNTPEHFANRIKKRCSMLAKGRLLGVQFDAMFTDNLYFEIGKQVIDRAEQLKEILTKKGYRFHLDSPTNQQFVVMDKATLERIRKEIVCTLWEWLDENTAVVRFATCWSTTEADLKKLESLL